MQGTRAIDIFAGFGGFTLGAEQAGVDVVWAGNHWPLAVHAHALNHPSTEHVCQDLRQADWTSLPEYELLLASPACQGHSQASQPKRRLYHDKLRATAWSVVDCAEVTRPRALIVENVVDFRRWDLYPVWSEALRVLGYQLQQIVIRASEHGVPQRRDRLFVVGTRTGGQVVLEPGPELAFGPFIDWDAPARWKAVSKGSANVQGRIERGRANHGARFLTQHVSNHPGVGLDEPIRTITTKDQWAVVDGDRYRPLTLDENARAMGFPETYRWPQAATRRECITGLGNAVPPPIAKKLVAAVMAVA